MKFNSISLPDPSKGMDYSKVKSQVVPNQSMSLAEILARFTRGEPLAVGQPVEYGQQEDVVDYNPLHADLEKIAHADLTEKDEFRAELAKIAKEYERQQAEKEAAKKARDFEEAEKARKLEIRKEARKLAAQRAKSA